MGTIRARKSRAGRVVSYQATVRLRGLQRPLYASFERLTEAKRWIQQEEARIREGRHFKCNEAKRHTVSELIERFIEDTFPDRKSKQSPKQTLKWWKERIGHLPLDQTTTAVISEHWEMLRRTPSTRTGRLLSPRSQNCYLETLSAAFTRAVKRYHWMDSNPCSNIERQRVRNARERYLSTEELHALLRAVDTSSNNYLKPAVLLSLATGGRYSSVMTLKWSQVDFPNRQVTFLDTKSGADVCVAVSETAWEALMEHARLRRLDTDYVFPSRKPRRLKGAAKNEKPFEDLTSAFERALSKAGIENFSWHGLRHQCASLLISAGASLAAVGRHLGHRTPQMSYRYSKLMKDHAREIVDRLDPMLKYA